MKFIVIRFPFKLNILSFDITVIKSPKSKIMWFLSYNTFIVCNLSCTWSIPSGKPCGKQVLNPSL